MLAATIAAVTMADVMLVAVHPGAPVILPQEMGWVAAHQRAADIAGTAATLEQLVAKFRLTT